ncbi:MauE/DoxX family redox-associated membrane protein [Longitalea luteola]|uniref:MauE/DoxX family redox-associated membrane protein n=1 Tax=Longitalea luteola TaxID=2812563 RepID=UPI001A96151E|nr:MauE/DoxX family redox-associated membrane protein [Longitalea luteola]
MKRKIIIEIISSLLILLFLYASVSKWLDFKLFIGEMNNQPFPNWMTPFLVWSIPFIEVIIALGLIFERTRVPALYASFVLMSAFTVYTVAILFHAFRYIPCSCGGVIRSLTWPQHLFFNLFFVGISLWGIILKKREPVEAIQT